VGAGDTFLSGFALALAAGAARPEAAYFAGLCGEVTIQKIGMTGTASAEEILCWFDRTGGRV
jgi:bifunctional ADP-heptose synthase (sugar kinase/adenylyltransferase)